MNIPIATDYFAEFLEEYCLLEDPSATYLFTLYIDLRQFNHAVSKNVDNAQLCIRAQEIQAEYLIENAPYLVQVRPEILLKTAEKIQLLE